MRVLLVEDDLQLARLLERSLTAEGYEVAHAQDGEPALELSRRLAPDAVVLDWRLPGTDGLAVCRALQGLGAPPGVLMLTANGEVRDRVAALDAGADDYLTKPFALVELLARLRAILRRRGAAGSGHRFLRAGPLRLGVVERVAYAGDRRIELTVREHKLLCYLVRAEGRAVARRELREAVWELPFEPGTNLIEVQVRRLREKLGELCGLVETVRGVGYRFSRGPTAR